MALFGSLRAVLQQKTQRFFAKRAPRQDDVKLGLNNVYVFFSRQGVLFALLLLVTFVMGVNYGNNLVLGLFFYLFAVWLVSVFYTFVQISGLSVRFVEATLTQAQSLAWITLEIGTRSKGCRQVYVAFDQQMPKHIQTPQGTMLTCVGAASLVRLPVYMDKRGHHVLPRLLVQSVYPLGVMRAWAYVRFASGVFVYPKGQPFEWQKHQSVTAQGEQANAMSVVSQDDFDRLDTYAQGESLSRVSWTHMARGLGMLTKHFADPVGYEWCLDYALMPSISHEQKLAQLVFAIEQLKELHVPFMLKLPNFQGQLGVGEAFVEYNLLQIAKEP